MLESRLRCQTMLRSDSGTVGILEPQTLFLLSAPHSLQRTRNMEIARLSDHLVWPSGNDHLQAVQSPLAVGVVFFKWIKLHFRIKKFYCTSENAVKVQIWTVLSVYVLLAIIKKCLHLDVSLYTLLQVFSVTFVEKIPLKNDFFNTKHILEDDMISNQPNLFHN